MKKINIPVGVSDFEKIRKENYCYVNYPFEKIWKNERNCQVENSVLEC